MYEYDCLLQFLCPRKKFPTHHSQVTGLFYSSVKFCFQYTKKNRLKSQRSYKLVLLATRQYKVSSLCLEVGIRVLPMSSYNSDDTVLSVLVDRRRISELLFSNAIRTKCHVKYTKKCPQNNKSLACQEKAYSIILFQCYTKLEKFASIFAKNCKIQGYIFERLKNMLHLVIINLFGYPDMGV